MISSMGGCLATCTPSQGHLPKDQDRFSLRPREIAASATHVWDLVFVCPSEGQGLKRRRRERGLNERCGVDAFDPSTCIAHDEHEVAVRPEARDRSPERLDD